MNIESAVKLGEAVGKNPRSALQVFAGMAGWPFLRAWIVMLALGVVHSVASAVPALGYWAVFVVLMAVGMLLNLVRRPRRAQ